MFTISRSLWPTIKLLLPDLYNPVCAYYNHCTVYWHLTSLLTTHSISPTRHPRLYFIVNTCPPIAPCFVFLQGAALQCKLSEQSLSCNHFIWYRCWRWKEIPRLYDLQAFMPSRWLYDYTASQQKFTNSVIIQVINTILYPLNVKFTSIKQRSPSDVKTSILGGYMFLITIV